VYWKQQQEKRREGSSRASAIPHATIPATMASSHLKDDKGMLPEHVNGPARDSHDIVSVQGGDLLDLESVDPVLNAKMKLVNDTIDEIGFTRYQAKLFVLNGFGYVIHFHIGRRESEVQPGGRKAMSRAAPQAT